MNGTVVDVGKGEPVLLLHGYPQSAVVLAPSDSGAGRKHRVIAADWPGFGRADPPDAPPTYDNEVEHIDRLADSFGLDRFNLVAHDYGGFLGLGYVLRHPDRVMRLALLNTRAHNVFRPWFYRFSRGQSWAAAHAPAHSSPAAAAPDPSRRPRSLPQRSGVSTMRSRTSTSAGWTPRGAGAPSSSSSRTTTCLRCQSSPTGLARISCPTAIIWGDRDRYIPFATARQLADAYPGRR